ncbi:MAG TPA: hypothetical protein VGM87_19260 [Roseomonas sp.]|jgi:hypothetical protein
MRRLLALLPLLAACADRGAAFDARMAGYVGRPESELVLGLGVPDRVQELEGQRILDYELRGASGGPLLTPSLGFGFGLGGGAGFGTGIGLGISGSAPPAACGVTFALRQGRVESFTRRGTGCA